MRIHKVELECVRNIRRAELDLSSPVTIVAGRNGTGKTTVQKSILGAMFQLPKKDRDTLVSRFDPDAEPKAILHLSRTGGEPITLARTLIDDKGEWLEGASRIRQKGAALQKVQETLPISAEAAALLLWGLQEEMSAVLHEFPEDGHSLLTAATIRGGGPDPKEAVAALEKQINEAKRRGQNPGSLSRAQASMAALQAELERAKARQDELKSLERKFDEAKTQRSRLERVHAETEQEVQQLVRLEQALEAACLAKDELAKLQDQQEKWRALDDQIKQARRSRDDLVEETRMLAAQLRVAKDAELADQIEALKAQLQAIDAIDRQIAELREQLEERRRPEAKDVETLRRLAGQVKEATDRMEASGLRYQLSVESGEQAVEVAEDQAPPVKIAVTPAKPYEGIVGRVVLKAGELRIAAAGKEDIAGLKRSIDQRQAEIRALLDGFSAKDEFEFEALATERKTIDESLKEVRNQRDKRLSGGSLEELRAKLARLEQARLQNSASQQDRELSSGRHLASAADIDRKLARADGQREAAARQVAEREAQRPSEMRVADLETRLTAARRAAADKRAEFQDIDRERREPAPAARDEIKRAIAERRAALTRATAELGTAKESSASLAAELKHAGPERPLEVVAADLEEAEAVSRREQILQQAREMLMDRINAKIVEMSAGVPRDLGRRIGEHLARLTGGALGQVTLSDKLHVSAVLQGGDSHQSWTPGQLSTGEKTLTSLVVKIAVARSLAETCGPVFVILDDSFVNLDPLHRRATEQLILDLVADGKLQVILLTCHTDWAEAWHSRAADQVACIAMEDAAEFYRPPMFALV